MSKEKKGNKETKKPKAPLDETKKQKKIPNGMMVCHEKL
jgi:hypothetical protein